MEEGAGRRCSECAPVCLGRVELALRAVEVALAAASVLWLKKPEREWKFGSPFSSKVAVCGHCLVTLPLTTKHTYMALIAAHLNAGVILVVTV